MSVATNGINGMGTIPAPPISEEKFKEELQKAVNFATKSHAGQFRKSCNLPYIIHPMNVLSLLYEWGVTDLVTWKATLCHDVREERPDITMAMVTAAIGKEAALVVEELSFFPDPQNNQSVSLQKDGYMKTFINKSLRSIVIKMGDRCCNTKDFMLTSPAYAPKYWRKGEPVFEAAISKNEQICLLLGPDVGARMKYTKDSLSRQLVR